MARIVGSSVPHTLEEALWKMKVIGSREHSRNGAVLTITEPVHITVLEPTYRVMTDPVRDANPFFHLAEFVWMMSGSNDVRFIEKYNRRMREYADPGTDVHHGAYGYRWRRHFAGDQLIELSHMLKQDPTTRRAVLGMWDPDTDLVSHPDLPCNTHIYFRVVNGELDMTVCNRSNDLLWGCMGANAVHMTLLHELMARSAGIPQGSYHVLTNNLHMYVDRPDFDRMLMAPHIEDFYRGDKDYVFPVLQNSESIESFLQDCEEFVSSGTGMVESTVWFNKVFLPAMRNWEAREMVHPIAANDWSAACAGWLERRQPKQLELSF